MSLEDKEISKAIQLPFPYELVGRQLCTYKMANISYKEYQIEIIIIKVPLPFCELFSSVVFLLSTVQTILDIVVENRRGKVPLCQA